MTAGVMDELKVRAEVSRPAFEPTRAARLRIWATCLTLAAVVQLAVVCALAPNAEPRYVVQLEAIEARPMFVPSRFSEPVPTPAPEAMAEPKPTPEPPPIPEPHREPPRTARPTPRRTARPAPEPSPLPTPGHAPEDEHTPTGPSGDSDQPLPGPHPEGGTSETASPGATGGAAPGTTVDGSTTDPHPSPGLWAQDVGARLSQGLRYPRAAEEDGVEGVTLLRLQVEADGRIVSVELVRSSGDERLDEAALARARTLERLPPPPQGTRAIDVPVHFRLP